MYEFICFSLGARIGDISAVSPIHLQEIDSTAKKSDQKHIGYLLLNHALGSYIYYLIVSYNKPTEENITILIYLPRNS